MPMLETGGGVRLHYRIVGNGRPLVFLHGLGGSMTVWEQQVLALAAHHRCICVDLRGHGESDKPDSEYTFAELGADVGALASRLDVHDAVLVGHSMGGALVLHHLLEANMERRFRKAAIVGGSLPSYLATPEQPWGPDEAAFAGILQAMRTAYAEVWLAMSAQVFHRQDLPGALARVVADANRVPLHAAYRLFENLARMDLRDRLADVDAPVLLLHGRHDQICDPRWIDFSSRALPAARLEWLEHSGHFPMLEEPERVTEELAAFAAS